MDEDTTPDWLDDYDRNILGVIEEYGVAVQGVFGDEGGPAFAYTVGLAARAQPEFLIFALPMPVAQTLLNDLSKSVFGGAVYAHGDIVNNLVAGYPVRMIEVADPSEHLTMANRLYRPAENVQVTALQVVFPDPEHRFPWEPGSTVANVPLLGPVPGIDEGNEITLPIGS